MKAKIAESLEPWSHLSDFDELVTVVDDLFSVMLDSKQIDRDQALEIISNIGDEQDVDVPTFKDIYNFAIILSQYDEINCNTIKQAYYQLKTKR